MNRIILLGHLTKTPELHKTEGEKPISIVKFDLAVNRKGKARDESVADFFHCTAFAKSAEFIEKYFDKGSRMMLSGRIENNNYTNDKGEKVYGYQVIVEDVEFADSKANSNDETYGG